MTVFSVSKKPRHEQWPERANVIERITDTNFSRLAKIFLREEDTDSYVTSPTYYAYTGRCGLWVYRYGDTFVPFCLHPNRDGKILIFPPRGKKNMAAIAALLAEIGSPSANILLARFKREDIDCLTPRYRFDGRVALAVVPEKMLDWPYPVRVLSTKNTVKMSGPNFMLVRNRIRQTKKYRIEAAFLSEKYFPDVECLIHRWAKKQADNPAEYISMTASYKKLLQLFMQKTLKMSGLVFTVDGNIQAATMWDVSNAENRTANIYMNLSNTSYRGLSEYSVMMTAGVLLEDNIQFMNLGGSETIGLDRYKNKFVPAYSVDLFSVEASMRTASLAAQTADAEEDTRRETAKTHAA